LIGYYLPDIQLSQRGRIEKISIKVAGSIYRACEQARLPMALYDEFDTYWQNGGYKKISDIIFAEWHIFIVSNL
jgi:hypothetical protein